ncbi:GNAT family N-acetyltransferase [Brachybacterium sp. AOP43-C2-M15]|uniref:GNAT family N-acetyltransferase n=1 Tax=Brachybacterium sp. AOP43-C2-M15 TaxID=3457661 RepID=UPI00403454FC
MRSSPAARRPESVPPRGADLPRGADRTEDRYHLRPVREEDAPSVLEAHRSAADMARQGLVTTLEQAREQVAWLLAEDRRAVAIADSAGDRAGPGTLVGLVALDIDPGNRLGWFFYWLHAAHRGRGLASRAAATVADRALRPSAEGGWGLERLELGHRANNPASGAVARAAGFVQEGREREKFLIDGERHDVLTCGRLVNDPPPAAPPLPWRP